MRVLMTYRACQHDFIGRDVVDGSQTGDAGIYATSDAGRQFGSSEAVGFGSSITTKDAPVSTAKFTTNDFCKVFDENDNEIPRGSETPGFIAFGGLCRLVITKTKKKPPKLSKPLVACAIQFRAIIASSPKTAH